MDATERKAIAAINRIVKRTTVKPMRRFWVCACGYKTIAHKQPKSCPRCGHKLKPDRII